MPPVVAVVYAHNEEAYLPHTLTTLFQFKRKGLINDIVVVDDASVDKTAEIARRFGAKVLSHSKQKGKRGCFVTGLKQAKRMGAEVMLSLDADIELFPEKTLRELCDKTMRDKFSMAVANQHERIGSTGLVPRRHSQTSEYSESKIPGVYVVKGRGKLEEYKKTYTTNSMAQRAIRLDALKPYFNRNRTWVMFLERDIPLQYGVLGFCGKLGLWGLEASLDYLIPKAKINFLKAPIFNRPVLPSHLGHDNAQGVAHYAVDIFASERSRRAANIKARREEFQKRRKRKI